MKMFQCRKGFTFIELITAAIIITIAVAGTYATFLGAVKLVGVFKHDIMSAIFSDALAQQFLSVYTFRNPDPANPFPVIVDDIMINPPATGPLENQLSQEVSSVDAPVYNIEPNVSLSATTPTSYPQYDFKRIDVKITRHERNI